MFAIKELQEKRAHVLAEAGDLLQKIDKEARGLKDDERALWDRLMDSADKYEEMIKRVSAIDPDEADSSAAKLIPTKAAGQRSDPKSISREDAEAERKEAKEDENRLFKKWLRYGTELMSMEEKMAVAQRMQAFDSGVAQQLTTEFRAQGISAGASGGYLVPQDFLNQVEIALKWYGGMMQVSTVITSTTGALLPMPTVNDTTNMGQILGENTQETPLDLVLGSQNLGAYTYSSRIVLVSLQLVQDAAFDVDGFVANRLGIRLGRILNNHFTIGTGASQPQGVVNAAVSGKVGITGQTTTIVYADIIDLIHSVDPAYRIGAPGGVQGGTSSWATQPSNPAIPGARFMFHDSTLKVIKKLVDLNGRPIFLPGFTALGGQTPALITDYPYSINQDVPVMAANAKSALFGDFSRYYVRQVLGMQLLRLVERYADFLQVGYLAFMRADGRLLDAGAGPVRFYQNSAT